jgi:hypothetical protein
MQCAPTTLEYYKFTAGFFLTWLEKQGVTSPDQTAQYDRRPEDTRRQATKVLQVLYARKS